MKFLWVLVLLLVLLLLDVVVIVVAGGGKRVNEERDEIAELGESGVTLLLLVDEDERTKKNKCEQRKYCMPPANAFCYYLSIRPFSLEHQLYRCYRYRPSIEASSFLV